MNSRVPIYRSGAPVPGELWTAPGRPARRRREAPIRYLLPRRAAAEDYCAGACQADDLAPGASWFEGILSMGKCNSAAGPVKPGPCHTAEGGIAVDAPIAVSGDGLDDVQPVGLAILGVMAGPGAALVLDFDTYAVARACFGADDEPAALQA